MEWTDGMEYRLNKIAKTRIIGRGKVVSPVLPLFSTLVPRPMRGMFCAWTRLCFGSVDVR